MSDDEYCPNLQIHIWVRTGKRKYRCEWMESGVLRECDHRHLYECCPARLEYDKEFRERYERCPKLNPHREYCKEEYGK